MNKLEEVRALALSLSDDEQALLGEELLSAQLRVNEAESKEIEEMLKNRLNGPFIEITDFESHVSQRLKRLRRVIDGVSEKR